MDDLIVNVVQRSFIVATPLLLATTGEIVTEKAGILNLGVEGLIAGSSVAAFITASLTQNPWLGMMAGLFVGVLLSSIHAVLSVSLRASQVVSGLAISMLGVGIAGVWGKPFIGQSLVHKFDPIFLPIIDGIPVVGPLLRQDIFFWIAILITLLMWFLLNHTLWGIKVRSTGENPQATDAQGVRVNGIKYISIMIGGALAGLAGAQLSLSYASSWIENMSGGRGWIAVALTIFALWNPLRALWAAWLFGGIFVLQYLLQPIGISPSLLAMLPYLTTLIVLTVYGMRRDKRKMQSPAMLGEIYKRGER